MLDPTQYGKADLIVSSPPYEASINAGNDGDEARQRKAERFASGAFKTQRPDVFTSQNNLGTFAMFNSTYGKSDGQVGAMQGDSFWEASRQIVQECYQLLKDGGEPVSDGEEIDFCNC